jgi:Arc/MetJ-type ribon-helix-helix transcriptional regulator
VCYADDVTKPIAVRLDQDSLDVLDQEVADGLAVSRSDAVRRSISYLARYRRYRNDARIYAELVSRGETPYPDLEGILDYSLPDLT